MPSRQLSWALVAVGHPVRERVLTMARSTAAKSGGCPPRPGAPRGCARRSSWPSRWGVPANDQAQRHHYGAVAGHPAPAQPGGSPCCWTASSAAARSCAWWPSRRTCYRPESWSAPETIGALHCIFLAVQQDWIRRPAPLYAAGSM